MKPYPKVVQEIHRQFETAGDRLLTEALEIINQTGQQSIDKAERLKNAGFVSAKEIQVLEKVELTKEVADLVNYYKANYPFNRFITKEQVVTICNKYNLVCAPVDKFTGFVPDVKLKQIENFKVKGIDKLEDVITNVVFAYEHSQFAEISENKRKHPDGIYHLDELKGSVSHINGAYVKSYDIIDNAKMLICAPEKDFNLKGLKSFGLFFKSLTKINVPDPVVLQNVKGGYLIVAAWGDEASDENVVNSINN